MWIQSSLFKPSYYWAAEKDKIPWVSKQKKYSLFKSQGLVYKHGRFSFGFQVFFRFVFSARAFSFFLFAVSFCFVLLFFFFFTVAVSGKIHMKFFILHCGCIMDAWTTGQELVRPFSAERVPLPPCPGVEWTSSVTENHPKHPQIHIMVDFQRDILDPGVPGLASIMAEAGLQPTAAGGVKTPTVLFCFSIMYLVCASSWTLML